MSTPIVCHVQLAVQAGDFPLRVRVPVRAGFADTNYMVKARPSWNHGAFWVTYKREKQFVANVRTPPSGTQTLSLEIIWG